jgi:hypothetical protein
MMSTAREHLRRQNETENLLQELRETEVEEED